MRALKFGFYLLITMNFVRLLTLISAYNPEIYWISPLYALIELLVNFNLYGAARILIYIIYPSLFSLSWLIVYILILTTISVRSRARQRFLILSIIGIIVQLLSVGMNFILYSLVTNDYNTVSLLNMSTTITGIFGLLFYITILSLPNIGYLLYYKILQVGGLGLYYLFWFIFLSIFAGGGNSSIILSEYSNLFFGLINILSFFYLMKYLESEQGEEYIPENNLL